MQYIYSNITTRIIIYNINIQDSQSERIDCENKGVCACEFYTDQRDYK